MNNGYFLAKKINSALNFNGGLSPGPCGDKFGQPTVK